MSRMIAYVADTPMSTERALGTNTLAQFLALATLHSDGWGTAWVDPISHTVLTLGGGGSDLTIEDLTKAAAVPASIRALYLRFASRGAPPSRENMQPFLRGGVAFQHNGLIAPRAELLALLSKQERDELRGTTDSEAYFAIARRSARREEPEALTLGGVTEAIRSLRLEFPSACLNAMLLSQDELFVVHSPGTSAPPLAAFRDRGVDEVHLPQEHDARYNLLRMTSTATGARVVSTTGIDQRGWSDLAVDSVFRVTTSSISRERIPHD